MAGFLPARSELFPWLKDAFLDEFNQHHMNWLRISAFISVAFPRKLHPEAVFCHARMSDPIFSWETHSTFMSRISIWFFYRAHKTLKSNWNNILEKSLLLKMKEAWKRNLAKLEEFPAMCGCFRFPAFAGFCCQSWFGFGGWTDTQISSDLSEGWRQKLGCLKQDVNGLFAGVPVDAAYLQASLRFSCWHSLRPPHVLGNERCGRFDTPVTTMADVRVQWRHKLIKPYDKNNQCMLESKWSGLKLQLEGTIDHLVSSVKMKDGIPLLSSTAGENMNETCVTWPRRKKRKSKAKKKL